ncbi:MAG: hypothetical protein B7Z29_20855 [Hyphomicrobium sp. 12-62-95]|nr:MAG: hypothetical protein B7Z29_20855 [Hyphomicrobium sp. 12-62-95]
MAGKVLKDHVDRRVLKATSSPVWRSMVEISESQAWQKCALAAVHWCHIVFVGLDVTALGADCVCEQSAFGARKRACLQARDPAH